MLMLMGCHFDANRDERVLDKKQHDLHKTQETHSKEQVQMTSNHANQVVHRHLGLLFHLLIGERVQVEDEPKQVLVFVVYEVRLVGAERAENRVGAERAIGVEFGGRKDI